MSIVLKYSDKGFTCVTAVASVSTYSGSIYYINNKNIELQTQNVIIISHSFHCQKIKSKILISAMASLDLTQILIPHIEVGFYCYISV